MTTVIEIKPIECFSTSLTPPPSKSLTNRALLLTALAEGRSTIHRPLVADDTRLMLEALDAVGIGSDLQADQQSVHIAGPAEFKTSRQVKLDLGNAGTAMRFLTAAACVWPGQYVLDGNPRMRQRPIGELFDALRRLGGKITYRGKEGFPPIDVRGGGLEGGSIEMGATQSSQFISALLMVGPYCHQGLTIHFNGPVTSRPYVDMTLALMARFGVQADVDADFKCIRIEPGRFQGQDYTVEPDASSASYFLAAAAICPGSKCTIEGLGKSSLQGDVGFADLLQKMGADMLYGTDFITVMSPAKEQALRGIDVDLNHMPDMVLTLAAVALFARGETVIRNVGNLRVKETDRLAALHRELGKLGARVKIDEDALVIEPPRKGADGILSATLDTYDDHRMAMSLAVIGLGAHGIKIRDPACVNKTFPQFFAYLESLHHQPSSAS